MAGSQAWIIRKCRRRRPRFPVWLPVSLLFVAAAGLVWMSVVRIRSLQALPGYVDFEAGPEYALYNRPLPDSLARQDFR
jgi:hypothetical protein